MKNQRKSMAKNYYSEGDDHKNSKLKKKFNRKSSRKNKYLEEDYQWNDNSADFDDDYNF